MLRHEDVKAIFANGPPRIRQSILQVRRREVLRCANPKLVKRDYGGVTMVRIALVSFRRVKAGYLYGCGRSLPILDGASFMANTVEEWHRESEPRINYSELGKVDGRDMVNDRRFKIDPALDMICVDRRNRSKNRFRLERATIVSPCSKPLRLVENWSYFFQLR